MCPPFMEVTSEFEGQLSIREPSKTLKQKSKIQDILLPATCHDENDCFCEARCYFSTLVTRNSLSGCSLVSRKLMAG